MKLNWGVIEQVCQGVSRLGGALRNCLAGHSPVDELRFTFV